MADIKAFRGIRPRPDLADRIAALPYDVYNRKEALAEVEKEPLSFLKIDRAETQFPDTVGTYEDCVYEKAKETLWDMKAKGAFIQDETPCCYLYELTMNGRSQTGIVACASIDDYHSQVIKKHENTREEKELDRIRHVDTCNAQTGPIFLAYRSRGEVTALVAQAKQQNPVYEFITPDGIGHRVWVIEDREQIEQLESAFGKIQEIYIADGHHRAASAVKVGEKRRAEHPGYTGKEEFNYFLAVLFPDEELSILDYNRVIKDLNGNTPCELLEKIQGDFSVEKREEPVRPTKKGEFGMYLEGAWYLLRVKPEVVSEDPVKGLDVSILQDRLLQPILGIQNPKTDARIDFVGGIRGLKELERRVAEDCMAAFSLYPTSIGELFAVADAGRLMPPKSTWFEPKLRSGLFIHEI